ncbi:tetratricopeptide repeat protein [uncultured Algibacter sp.]|uniref:tetratricopeptide repeat protein n=1 Tax=uncultured Algibacter sp. TaxID=298659 RepID=UPI0032178AF3
MKYTNDITQELLEAIERYIKGTMDSKELKDFNDYIKIDPEFKAQVEDIKVLLLGIEKQTLEDKLNEFHEDIINNKKQLQPSLKVQFLNHNKLAIVASIIVATLSIWYFITPKNIKLYDNYFKPDIGINTNIKDANSSDFNDAMEKYKNGNYKIAIDAWQILSERKPKNDTLNYFIGIAHLANKKTKKAIPFLERTVHSNHTFALMDNARYYLGLAYLKEGNSHLAKKYLKLSRIDSAKYIINELN